MKVNRVILRSSAKMTISSNIGAIYLQFGNYGYHFSFESFEVQ
jgi:hypothetical protein